MVTVKITLKFVTLQFPAVSMGFLNSHGQTFSRLYHEMEADLIMRSLLLSVHYSIGRWVCSSRASSDFWGLACKKPFYTKLGHSDLNKTVCKTMANCKMQ